jgi:Zn-dependent M28 family amino/carboxypeptidase
MPKGYEVSNKPGAKEKGVFRYGSDHYSFVKKDIPISVFFTGLHNDYHSPRDTPDKINYKNLTQITEIVYRYIYKAAELR